jgi:transcriptional regulator with XRE-family HTH domain
MYSAGVGKRLRELRRRRGLTLLDVENQSGGEFKTAVVGAYERGTRSVSVRRLVELANFYEVPASTLLPEPEPPAAPARSRGRVMLDVARLRQMPAEVADLAYRFIRGIQANRSDYSGDLLSLREVDIRALAIMYEVTPDELIERWMTLGIALPADAQREQPNSFNRALRDQFY